MDLLHRWLLRRRYAGQIGPVHPRDPRPATYALTVPRTLALAEWNEWNPGAAMSEEVFIGALNRQGIHSLDWVPTHKRS